MSHRNGIRNLFILSCILMSTFFVTACNSKETIKIGFVGGLTGNSSEIGVDGRNGAMLAVLQVNKAGGIKGQSVELVVEDDKNDKEMALEADKRLVDQGVKAIIGHMTSSMAEKTIPFIAEKNILMISPTISLNSLLGIDDNFLRIISSNQEQGEFLADVAFKREKSKKIAVIYDNRNKAFAQGVKASFEQRIQSYGGQIVLTEIFNTGDIVSYSSIIQRIGTSDADGILVIASSADAAMFCQHFFKNNIKKPIFMPMWSMTNDLIKQGGPTVEGVLLINLFDWGSSKPEYGQFRRDYYEKYGSEPTFASLLGYEATILLCQAMNSAKDLSTISIKEAIIKKKIFKGLQDEILIDEYGDTKRKNHLYMVKNGLFIKVEE